MRRPAVALALLIPLLAGAGAVTAGLLGASPPAPHPADAAARIRRAEERLVRGEDIRFFQARIARDPSGATDLVRLARLLLAEGRASGEERDLVRAEAASRRALANRPERNAPAWQTLTAALLGQHRFGEAVVAARRALEESPGDAAAQAALGEVLLELGEYPAADTIFRGLTLRRFDPAIAPRYARWLELRGHAGDARRLLERARDEAVRAAGPTSDQLAWYELRLGDLALRFGAHREAARRLDAGLALAPDDWRLLATRARLALVTGDLEDAIALGDSSLARHLDPASLALVGDALQARGEEARATEYFRAMEAMSRQPAGGFHRAWYLALLDHDRQIPEVLAAVERDLRSRRDVYGQDLYAWALFKSGRLDAARTAARQALAWGTEDPELRSRRIPGVLP